MIHSVAGLLQGGRLLRNRQFREPHQGTSLPALVGGSSKAKPGEIKSGAQWRAFSGRAAGIPPAGARSAAPAAGNRQGDGGAGECPCHISGALSACRRDESMPLRLPGRPVTRLRSGAEVRCSVPVENQRPHVRPDRLPCRCAAGQRRRSEPAATGGRQRRSRGPRCRRAGDPGGTAEKSLYRAWRRAKDQCGSGRRSAGADRGAGPAGPNLADGSRRAYAAVGAGISPRAARRAYAGGSGAQHRRTAAPHRRGAELPACEVPAAKRPGQGD